MHLSFEVGKNDKHYVDFTCCHFWGNVVIKVDEVVVRRDLAMFMFGLEKEWNFPVGTSEFHMVTIRKIRPLLLAGFRPHRYIVYIDGEWEEESEGY
jgi:hypothetical protein